MGRSCRCRAQSTNFSLGHGEKLLKVYLSKVRKVSHIGSKGQTTQRGKGVFHTEGSVCPQAWLGGHGWLVCFRNCKSVVNVIGVLNTCDQETWARTARPERLTCTSQQLWPTSVVWDRRTLKSVIHEWNHIFWFNSKEGDELRIWKTAIWGVQAHCCYRCVKERLWGTNLKQCGEIRAGTEVWEALRR